MSVGILALQGDFEEHAQKLSALGKSWVELRCKEDLALARSGHFFDRIILPGGESTTQGKLLRELGMLGPLKELIAEGMPVLGTCAGLILLAQDVVSEQACLATLPVRVKRNAYGRQLESFRTAAPFGAVPANAPQVPMTFIRAPYIESVLSEECTILARVDGNIVGVQYHNQIGISFHPELDADNTVFELFLGL